MLKAAEGMVQCYHERANFRSHTHCNVLAVFQMCRHLRFSLGACMGQCKITPVSIRLKSSWCT